MQCDDYVNTLDEQPEVCLHLRVWTVRAKVAFFAVTWAARQSVLIVAPDRLDSLEAMSFATASDACRTTGECGTQNGCMTRQVII
jgi:hypothetical protein